MWISSRLRGGTSSCKMTEESQSYWENNSQMNPRIERNCTTRNIPVSRKSFHETLDNVRDSVMSTIYEQSEHETCNARQLSKYGAIALTVILIISGTIVLSYCLWSVKPFNFCLQLNFIWCCRNQGKGKTGRQRLVDLNACQRYLELLSGERKWIRSGAITVWFL